MARGKIKRILWRFAPTKMVTSEESVKKTCLYSGSSYSIFIPIENVVISGENNKVIKPL